MTISSRFLWPLLLAACLQADAAVQPPEKLLPKDTLLVMSAPDWGKATLFWSNQPYAKLWQDPSLKPFKDKFMDKFTAGMVEPMEKTLGIKFSDYQGLAQGQVTLALVPIVAKTKSDAPVAAILLMDTKDHTGQLKTNLAQVFKKWADAGKPMKTQKIRETDFTTLFISPDDLSKSMSKIFSSVKPVDPSDDDAKAATNKLELTVGQSDSLLVVSSSTEAIDKVLSRQAGGMIPPLEESSTFAADYGPRLRESPFYVWLNAKALIDLITKAAAASSDDAAHGPFNLDTILSATGLGNLSSLSLSYKHFPEGDCSQFFLAVPEDKRPAVLKMFAAEAKDSTPPSFVPADAVKFGRWRLNLAHSWKEFETMLNNLLPPQAMAQINMVLGMAGKDKDEHYDLKSELLNNLGDDIITYSKATKGNTLDDLKSSPSIFLVASPNPDKLTAALKVVMALVNQGSPITDREFLGRKIYTAAPPQVDGKPATSGLSFSASGGYLALSSDASILEEYLRSNDSKAKALSDMPGLADAAQKVGGMGTGLFGYENENQSIRPVFDVMRKQSFTLQDLLSAPIPNAAVAEQLESIRQWADFSLLPSFDTVSKYFYFSVYAGGFSPDGFSLKVFMPTPPQLRK